VSSPVRIALEKKMTVELEGFTAEVIDEEASRLGIPAERLVSFSVLYYLADVDSGRIAGRVAKGPLMGAEDLFAERLHTS
jgi:hypothetical protein